MRRAVLTAVTAQPPSTGMISADPPIFPCLAFAFVLSCACGIRAVETFAKALAQDGNAVRAALTMPWSNAQAEGQITKLKLLKRSMYGRAKLDLLRQRLLLAA
jgi:Transposase